MNPALQRQPAFIPSPTAESVLAESAGDAAFATTLAKGLVVLEAFDADAPMLGNMELSARTGAGLAAWYDTLQRHIHVQR